MRYLLTFLLALLAVQGFSNPVYNSSFELGSTAGGWCWAGPGQDFDGVTKPPTIATGSSQHGDYAAVMKNDGNNVQILSRPFWLDGSTQYTASLYARFSAGSGGNFKWGLNLVSSSTSTYNQETVSGSWARYSKTITSGQAGYYVIWCANFNPSSTILVDAVMVNAGASADAYAVKETVEIGLQSAMPFNLYTASDTATVSLNFYNDSTSASQETYVTIFDFQGDEVSSAFYTNTAASGLTSQAITLPINGWQRIVARDVYDPADQDEIICQVYPLASRALVNNYDGRFGTHNNYSGYINTNYARVGFTWNRTLSVSRDLFRWQEIEPVSGSYVFTHNTDVREAVTNGLIMLGQLGPDVNADWPSWFTNASGEIDLTKFSNYVWRTVNNYGPNNLNYVTNWSIWNEFGDEIDLDPTTGQPELADTKTWLDDMNNMADVIAQGLGAVKSADPNAVCLVFEDWNWKDMSNCWAAFDATTKSYVDVIGMHMYPYDKLDTHDHNRYFGEEGLNTVGGYTYAEDNQYNRVVTDFGAFGLVAAWDVNTEWANSEAPGVDLWNTEYGIWGAPIVGGPDNYWYSRHDYSSHLGNAASEGYYWLWEQFRGPALCSRIIKATTRSFGKGFTKNFYYDGRSWYMDTVQVDDANGYNGTGNHTTLSGHGNRNFRQQFSALMVCQSMLDEFTAVRTLTNSTAGVTDIEWYLFECPGSNVVAAWSLDMKWKDLSGLIRSYTVYDMMGNEVSQEAGKIRLGRYPQYLVSTATAANIESDLEGATVAEPSNTTGPNVYLSVVPASGGNDRITWAGYGGRWINDQYDLDSAFDNHTNIVWQISTNNTDWIPSTYTQSNWVTLNLASDSEIWLRGKDRDQNVTTYYYQMQPTAEAGGGDPGATITNWTGRVTLEHPSVSGFGLRVYGTWTGGRDDAVESYAEPASLVAKYTPRTMQSDGLWNDETGVYNCTVADAAYKPDLTTNVMNGYSALSFDGIEDELVTGITGGPAPETITVSAFVCPRHSSGAEMVIGRWLTEQHRLYVTVSANVWVLGYQDSSYTSSVSTTPAADDTWYHLVVVGTGDRAEFYVDGELAETRTFSESGSSYVEEITIGTAGTGNGFWFDGLVMDVRIYDEALTPAQRLALEREINRLYRNVNEVEYTHPASIAAWYRPDGLRSDGWDDQLGSYDITQATANFRPNTNTATLHGVPVANFDGGNDYLDTGWVGAGTSNLTVSVYCKFDLDPPNLSMPFGRGGGTDDRTYATATGDGNWWTFGYGSAGANPISSVATDTEWRHVVVRFNHGTASTIYVDGVVADSRTGSVGSAWTKSLFMGAYNNGSASDFEFDGSIADFRIYEADLSDTDREALQREIIRLYR